ncbi:hypothetical protein GGR42_001932 [Saonia flava]|uniref:Ig-like domain-containing protein n=1 Tax=Saonia flava TaxID=523696 RepID=A0A846QX08_9FLAO|nr:gliding motility-associated C-terminal domain-containing protein [Saonia flava]NJB71470.1 hypothetical protein [Saonia flava]
MKPNLHFTLLFTIVLSLFGSADALHAQTLNKPEPADNPNTGGNSIWTAACASESFNEYFVNFTWNPPLVNSDNSFILELSDANGSFSNPVELVNDNSRNTDFDFEFQFVLPTDTRGEGYRFRVKSTSPAKTSPESDAFPMYYIDYDSPLLISPNGDGNIPSGGTIQLCDGSSTVLSPHNITNADTYQYNWYKSSTLLGEKGPSLTVSSPGMYYVEIDYGSTCSGSANTLSNTIEITIGASLGIAINNPSKTDLCSGETVDLEANIIDQGLTYVWYKDGVAITSPTVDNDTYTVDASVAGFEGDYTVEIDGSGTCLELSAPISITNAGDFTVTVDNPNNIVVLPGQTKTLSVSTTASSPLYQWYKDGVQITGATTNSIDVTQAGVYYAAVTLSGGACSSTTVNSEQTMVVSPAAFEINIDYATSYTSCSNTSIVLEVSSINAVAGDGSKTDVTTDLISSFSYQWQKDGANISGETSTTISLTDISENGNYVVDAALTSYSPASNPLSVKLLVNETLTIASNGTVSCSNTDLIDITTSTDLSTGSFEWFRDGASVSTTEETLRVSETGVYQLVVQRNGCPLISNEITISPFDDSLITLDSGERVVFPEGSSKIVRATGGTAYRWLDMNNNLLSNSDSVTFTDEGDYILVASIGNCEITKSLTVDYLETFKVPNVITVNGDGINDQWVLPNSYSNDAEVTVTIYNEKGEEVINETNYQNNWPSSTTAFAKQNEVFFYKIRKASEVLKQGTVTVIR